jgi:CHAT domain-containing protein
MAVLLYILNGKQLLIFTATNKKVGVKEVTLTADLEKMVDQYVSNLSNPAIATGTGAITLRSTIKKKADTASAKLSFKDLSNNLYKILISPVEEDIKDYKALCIIPNGKLSSLPFSAIGNRNADSSVSFLTERYSIFYTNKLDVFMRPGRKDKSLESFTAFGNPDNTLASAGDEVEAIGKMLQVKTVYLKNEATESRAKESLEKSRYVHFATHGVLNYTDFSSSYLKMAPITTATDDGELRIDEIKSIDISGCDLVTLSACETAVNQELKKGWYISPANAFLVNRVRSVVATLWAVDDKATNLFMQEFYKNLQTMEKSQALRAAQATLSKTPGFQHPFYWAPFVLYGDWR